MCQVILRGMNALLSLLQRLLGSAQHLPGVGKATGGNTAEGHLCTSLQGPQHLDPPAHQDCSGVKTAPQRNTELCKGGGRGFWVTKTAMVLLTVGDKSVPP